VKSALKKIPRKVLANLQLKLNEVMDALEPYLVELSPPERRALVKMEADSARFVELSHAFAVRNPDMLPCFAKTDIFGEKFSIAQELWTFAAKLNHLMNMIRDTEMVAGNLALEDAMVFYQTVKIAARRDIPGARVIFEELKPTRPSARRKQQRRRTGVSRAS
jgi:hypothetical protein